jgi:hypothetical protein
MGKAAPDIVLDAPADVIDQSNIMHLCSAEPANYAGIAAVSLADVAMTVNTDYTKANGDTSGRKVTVAAKNTVTVDASGTATHVVLASTGDTTLRYVTTCTSQAVTSGNTVNFPAWDIEFSDPT